MIPENKLRKTRIKAELSVFDDELTAEFNPRDFIPDAPVHARKVEAKAAPIQITVTPTVKVVAPARVAVVTLARKVAPAPAVVATPARTIAAAPSVAPAAHKYGLEPSQLVLSKVEEIRASGTAKVRFFNPTSSEVSATLTTPMNPTQVWLLTLSGKRSSLIPIAKGRPISISIKPRTLMNIELVFANC
jgi:hypothetical protein